MGESFEVVAPQFGLCDGGEAAAEFCSDRFWKRQVSVFSSPSARGVWMCRSASSRQRWEGGEWSHELASPPSARGELQVRYILRPLQAAL